MARPADIETVTTAAAEARTFTARLRRSCARVGPSWFLLPVAEPLPDPATDDVRVHQEAVHRERVYCYELYHQLRCAEPGQPPEGLEASDYVLSGELDKRGLDTVSHGGQHKPDLAWHLAGDPFGNAVVVEVKQALAGEAGLAKDLRTLATFVDAGERSYHSGVLLLFGESDRDDLARRVVAAADRVVAAGPDRREMRPLTDHQRSRIRVLWHPSVGARARQLGTVGGLGA